MLTILTALFMFCLCILIGAGGAKLLLIFERRVALETLKHYRESRRHVRFMRKIRGKL